MIDILNEVFLYNVEINYFSFKFVGMIIRKILGILYININFMYIFRFVIIRSIMKIVVGGIKIKKNLYRCIFIMFIVGEFYILIIDIFWYKYICC